MKTSIYALCIALCATAISYKATSAGKVVCYYGSWASYRPGNGKCEPENVDPFICTHLIYSFIGLDPETNQVKHLDTWLAENLNAVGRFIKLRESNPSLKLLIAIGGWNDGSVKYSNMAASASARSTFVKSVIDFIIANHFDGLDIDWEYPAANGGSVQDKQNYALLIKELREEFDKYGFLMSAAVAAGKSTIEAAYDGPAISKYFDFINVMAYDYHGSWETITGPNAPLYSHPSENAYQQLLNVNTTIHTYINIGVAPEKLILGIGTYGISFTLANPSVNGNFAPVAYPGHPGPYTQVDGTLGYNEILEKLSSESWTVVTDPYYKTPYAYSGNQWVGYDDEESTRLKCNLAKSLGLGGGMVWSIETDDFRGVSGKKYPILSVINEVFGSNSGNSGNDDSAGQEKTTTTTSTTTTTAAAAAKTTTTKAGTTQAPAAVTTTRTTTTKAATTTTKASGTTNDISRYVLSLCPTKTHIRHPDYCNKFFTCTKDGSNYNIWEFTCQSGLLFDENNKICNWQSSVKC